MLERLPSGGCGERSRTGVRVKRSDNAREELKKGRPGHRFHAEAGGLVPVGHSALTDFFSSEIQPNVGSRTTLIHA